MEQHIQKMDVDVWRDGMMEIELVDKNQLVKKLRDVRRVRDT